MGKDEKKKQHRKSHRDQMNGSWFQIGGKQFWGSGPRGEGDDFFFRFFEKFQKTRLGKDKRNLHRKFHRDQENENWFKILVSY